MFVSPTSRSVFETAQAGAIAGRRRCTPRRCSAATHGTLDDRIRYRSQADGDVDLQKYCNDPPGERTPRAALRASRVQNWSPWQKGWASHLPECHAADLPLPQRAATYKEVGERRPRAKPVRLRRSAMPTSNSRAQEADDAADQQRVDERRAGARITTQSGDATRSVSPCWASWPCRKATSAPATRRAGSRRGLSKEKGDIDCAAESREVTQQHSPSRRTSWPADCAAS